MSWPPQNFLLCKSIILFCYFTSMILRLHAIEDEIRFSRVFQKKKRIVEHPMKLYTPEMYNHYF